jgi:hypothetical protein
VIWGEHDAYLPSAYAARQREAFPDADVHVLAGSGHWPFVDAAPTVDGLLREFLTRAVASASTSASASAGQPPSQRADHTPAPQATAAHTPDSR